MKSKNNNMLVQPASAVSYATELSPQQVLRPAKSIPRPIVYIMKSKNNNTLVQPASAVSYATELDPQQVLRPAKSIPRPIVYIS